MVKITEELIRKKAEHNESIIGTLEELSLHQEDVDGIDNVQNWCRHLEILLLQSNLIPKIENLHKLKKLKYLNLAINNIEVIENLERCESLEKLDLTLNFIGDLESVKSLCANVNLKELYLTGNPCADYQGYRDYVIGNLLNLHSLDNKEITRGERLRALQKLPHIEAKILQQQKEYACKRQEQIKRLDSIDSTLVDDETFWHSPSEHAPEVRREISRRTRLARSKDKNEADNGKAPKSVLLFNKQGLPLNVNQAKLDFTFEEEGEYYHLDIAVYKFLDSAYIEVDLQPKYVTVSVKGKIFQYVFPEEVSTSESKAQRSQTTGHLLIKAKRVMCCGALNVKPKIKKLEKPPEKPDRYDTNYLEVPDNPSPFHLNRVLKEELHPEIPPLEFC